MKQLRRTVLTAALGGLLALAVVAPAIAAETAETTHGALAAPAMQETDEGVTDVVPGVIWTLVGIAIGAVVLGTLYLLKRRVGAFPENPSWVAPIYVTPASENPTEETFGMVSEHEDHAPSH